jgi:Ulp1 protease family, C-terminal catalytic domain
MTLLISGMMPLQGRHLEKLALCSVNVMKAHLIELISEIHYIPQPSPQQANVSDCGIHVLYNTRVLLQRLMHPVYRPARPWDLSDIDPDTAQNRAALRMLFQQRLTERLSSSAERESQEYTS